MSRPADPVGIGLIGYGSTVTVTPPDDEIMRRIADVARPAERYYLHVGGW